MKRWIALTAALLVLLCGCAPSAPAQSLCVSNLAGADTLEEVCTALEEAGAGNTDVFREWVEDYSRSVGEAGGLAADWSAPDSLAWDLSACMDGWEASHDYSDADCRMTAFLLLGSLISSDRVDEDYRGSYLMFDVDAIETAERYELLREKQSTFTTLFGERSLGDSEQPEEVFSDFWKEYGLQVNSQRLALLSVVLYDPNFGVSFVGHTGVLADCGDHLLFVEKIAFEQPYQVTRAESLEEILDMLSERGEYFGQSPEEGPYIYRNGEYLGRLEKANS